MVADDNVTPIGARLGSEKLYADARPEQPEPPREDTVRLARDKTRRPPPPPPVVTPKPAPAPPRDRRRRAQELLATAFELIGTVVIVVGLWWLAPWAGLIVAGLAAIVIGAALSPSLTAARARRRKGGDA